MSVQLSSAQLWVHDQDAALEFWTKKIGFELPARGEYGVGMLFLPLDDHKRKAAEAILVRVCRFMEVSPDRVSFVVFSNETDRLPRHLREADMLAMPTIAQEALGRTAVEAMAARFMA